MSIEKPASGAAFTLERRDDGIALLKIDVPGEKMNTLRGDFAASVRAVLEEIIASDDIKGVVIASGKPDNFIAGADIRMLQACTTARQAEDLGREGQQLFAQLEALNIPVVAAIHGPCLGGGLELALACHFRVCSDSSKTQLGLPEVQLGLLPGSGGTQRLPRLLGLAKSLDLILTGRSVRPKQALKMGLVDEMVPESVLLKTAIELAAAGKKKAAGPRVKGAAKWLENNPAGRALLFSQVRKQTRVKTLGNYPAAEAIIEVIEQGSRKGFEAGLALEAKRFGELVMTPVSRQLRNIFFATTEMKKAGSGQDAVKPGALDRIAVLGGGLMGGGIAYVTATKAGLPVRMKDISQQGISNALKYSYQQLDKKVKRRFMSRRAAEAEMAKISGSTEWTGFSRADLVVEAVFEDLDIKRQMVKAIEERCQEHTVFATNTSSIPITDIARDAQRPQNVVGLHYFSPVEKMPLVEIITHDKVAPETVATVTRFARKQGKTPIVVRDGAGFYVNRILAPYMNEAARALLEGADIAQLDGALRKFGFPVGPFQLLDEVGVDIGAKISPILLAAFGERFAVPDMFDILIADKRLGRKTRRGFYQYQAPTGLVGRIRAMTGGSKRVDPVVYSLLGAQPRQLPQSELAEVVERCTLMMLNEAVRCLDEQIIASARDGDIGAIFGIGFPPFLGGPFRMMDALGAEHLVERLRYYQQQQGERFAPAAGLVALAEQQQGFYPAEADEQSAGEDTGSDTSDQQPVTA